MEILVSKMDQNLVSVSKLAKATELAPRLLGQSDSHSTINRHLHGKGAFISLLIISILGKRETEHGKDSPEEADRPKAQGTESPSVSCPPHSMAVHS